MNGGDGLRASGLGTVGRSAVAASLAGAALIHATVMGEHFEEWAPAGVFFLSLVLVECVLGVLVLLAWTRTAAHLVVLTGVGTVAVWVVSRTVGMPIGPADFRVPEPVGTADLVCGGLELVAAAVCAYSLTRQPRAVGSARFGHGAPCAVATALVLVTVATATAIGVAPALSSPGGHHARAAAGG